MPELLIEVFKYLLPSLVVLVTAYLVLSSALESQLKLKGLEVALKNQGESLPLRLQAYERLTLLLERISPNSLVARNSQANLSVTDMQMLLIANIRQEFDHNLTQQLYVSNELWTVIKSVVEEMISTVNGLAGQLSEEDSGNVLCRALLEYFISAEIELPTERALEILKTEARTYLK